jgi:hypothetical protein
MHLVTWSEFYNLTTCGVVTQALGKVTKLFVKVGDVQCLVTFIIVDTNNYDLLLGLDVLIKMGVMVDVEKSAIQIRQGPKNNIQVLPLNMVNMLQMVIEGNHVEDEER